MFKYYYQIMKKINVNIIFDFGDKCIKVLLTQDMKWKCLNEKIKATISYL